MCIVDTSFVPAIGYCCLIENRSASVLMEIINNVVLPNSIIHTDEWPAYKGLRNSEYYDYKTVCHKYNFVNPSDGTHIQHAESFDNKLKLKIKELRGLKRDQRKDFLNRFMYRERFRTDKFVSFIKLFKYFF